MKPNKIKLIIWDLDETFWQGVLSEGPVVSSETNVDLVKLSLDAGVIHSICSKNDFAPVKEKMEELGIFDLFVFPMVNWMPKGAQIRDLLAEIGLRACNVLFIDDNHLNRKEAEHYNEELMTAGPECIPELYAYFQSAEKSDPTHKRLMQYKVLEEKHKDKEQFSDNLAFLANCHIKLKEAPCDDTKRISELILRSNQLNFTKNRISEEELKTLLQNPDYLCRSIYVRDDYGDYGLIGFYALHTPTNTLTHFLFSCRTIGMGIEQYVYETLDFPQLEISGAVITTLEKTKKVTWIQPVETFAEDTDNAHRANIADTKAGGANAPVQDKYPAASQESSRQILFKGPCDIRAIFNYVNIPEKNYTCEFTYIEENGVSIESQNHTDTILSAAQYTEEELAPAKELPFYGKEFFSKEIFNPRYGLVFFSMLTDPNLGVYRHKKTGFRIAFGEYIHDLTDAETQQKYMDGTVFTSNCHFTKEFLNSFAADYEYCGRVTPAESFANIKQIREKMPKQTKLALILGSEIAYEKNHAAAYEKREEYHREFNRMAEEWAKNRDDVILIHFTDFIASQSDFLNNINHYMPNVYFQMAKTIRPLLAGFFGEKNVTEKGKAFYLIKWAKAIYRKVFRR